MSEALHKDTFEDLVFEQPIVEQKPKRAVNIQLLAKLEFLLHMHRYKIVYGGRGGAKSTTFADALLTLGSAQKLRILCAREIQDSIKQSVHKLLSDRIAYHNIGTFYQVLENEIRGANGTEITFVGLGRHTTESIKSYEGIDIVWVEEAQTVSKRSWDILIPTIRAKNSEIWVSFNPDMSTDETWQRFVEHPPEGAMVRKMNWSDNIWFKDTELEKERLHCKRVAPDDYDNIWEGKCRVVLAGAIYAREITDMIEDGRIRPTPYDPRFQVHTVWDLGWNDAMSIIMVQKTSPSVLNIINYMEDSFQRYDEFVADLNKLRYNWGWDWLPHDAINKNAITGTDAYTTLKKLGRRVKPPMEKTGDEPRIKAARMLFPRIYIDPTERKRPTGFLGGARLIECLKHFRRNIPLTTGEPGSVRSDQYTHACDAFGALAEIADRIVDDGAVAPPPRLPDYVNTDVSMGCLG